MRVVPYEPVGAAVTGLSMRHVDGGLADELRALLAEHGVLFITDQRIDDAAFVAFMRFFGELRFTVGETPVPGFDDLNVVSNVGRSTPPRSTFHTDTSYVRAPPAYTALRAVKVPRRGGDTLFTNQYRAAETLTDEMRTHLADRTITHVMTGLDLDADAETSADHPILRRHPSSGRTALFLSAPQRCAAVSGMTTDESAETIRYLFDHSTSVDNIVRHSWRSDDLVIWDNRCVLHRADHDGVHGDRVMHRSMAADARH